MTKQKVVPIVNMGLTMGVGSDRYSYTITEVINERKIVAQKDHAVCVSGNSHNSEMQTWEHTPNPNAPEVTFTKRKNGRWVPVGQGMNSGCYAAIGFRNSYRDPHF